jgi:hypothetical protein
MMLRKQILRAQTPSPGFQRGEKDIAAVATVMVTSETAGNPIDNAFDSQRGPGATRWVAAEPGDQMLIVAFDTPERLRQVCLEVEEPEVSRVQELHVAISCDGGATYRDLLCQEYNFNPSGATFEREEWAVDAEGVTHVRLLIRPDKGGKPCRATLTSLALR